MTKTILEWEIFSIDFDFVGKMAPLKLGVGRKVGNLISSQVVFVLLVHATKCVSRVRKEWFILAPSLRV